MATTRTVGVSRFHCIHWRRVSLLSPTATRHTHTRTHAHYLWLPVACRNNTQCVRCQSRVVFPPPNVHRSLMYKLLFCFLFRGIYRVLSFSSRHRILAMKLTRNVFLLVIEFSSLQVVADIQCVVTRLQIIS